MLYPISIGNNGIWRSVDNYVGVRVSPKAGNALSILTTENEEGLYVPLINE